MSKAISTLDRDTQTEHRNIFIGKIGIWLKRLQLMHTSSMTYGAETWAPANQRRSYSSPTNKNGKEYVKHHIPGQKNKHPGKRKDEGHRRD